jgi:hypothetical protein
VTDTPRHSPQLANRPLAPVFEAARAIARAAAKSEGLYREAAERCPPELMDLAWALAAALFTQSEGSAWDKRHPADQWAAYCAASAMLAAAQEILDRAVGSR